MFAVETRDGFCGSRLEGELRRENEEHVFEELNQAFVEGKYNWEFSLIPNINLITLAMLHVSKW